MTQSRSLGQHQYSMVVAQYRTYRTRRKTYGWVPAWEGGCATATATASGTDIAPSASCDTLPLFPGPFEASPPSLPRLTHKGQRLSAVRLRTQSRIVGPLHHRFKNTTPLGDCIVPPSFSANRDTLVCFQNAVNVSDATPLTWLPGTYSTVPTCLDIGAERGHVLLGFIAEGLWRNVADHNYWRVDPETSALRMPVASANGARVWSMAKSYRPR